MSGPDDQSLSATLSAIRETSPEARERFGRAFDRLAPVLYAWVRARMPGPLGRMVEPTDVVQEAWCRALARWSKFDASRGPMRAWLIGFARNILREIYTDYHRRPWVAGDASHSRVRGIEGIPDEATAVSMRVARDEAVEQFMETLARLPDDDREVVLLRGLEELSHDEIAAHLGVAPHVVRKRWTRLRERLAAGPVPDWLTLN